MQHKTTLDEQFHVFKVDSEEGNDTLTLFCNIRTVFALPTFPPSDFSE